jgi:hypothetical protein
MDCGDEPKLAQNEISVPDCIMWFAGRNIKDVHWINANREHAPVSFCAADADTTTLDADEPCRSSRTARVLPSRTSTASHESSQKSWDWESESCWNADAAAVVMDEGGLGVCALETRIYAAERTMRASGRSRDALRAECEPREKSACEALHPPPKKRRYPCDGTTGRTI